MLLAASDSIKAICCSANDGSSSSRCNQFWWSSWWRLAYVAWISTTVLILSALFHKVNLLAALEATWMSITTLTRVISTTSTINMILTTTLCNTIFGLSCSIVEVLWILDIILTYVSKRRCTRKSWCMPLLFLKWLTIRSTFLLPKLILMLDILFFHSSLSLNFSSSTCFTQIINYDMSM